MLDMREDLPETQRYSGPLQFSAGAHSVERVSFASDHVRNLTVSRNDESGPCAPGGSKISADMHDRVPVSSVGGSRAHSDVCDRLSVSSCLGKASEEAVATGLF